MIIGPDLATMKERAKMLVMWHFVRIAEKDGVPATLRAMYVRKAEQARVVMNGGTSSLISGEAGKRGIAPKDLAASIVAKTSEGGDRLEIERMGVNVAIDAAKDAAEVISHLSALGLTYTDQDTLR